jgi:hypothetical protein
MVVWIHTSDVDDVEIVEAYLQKHEFEIGVVPKPVDKIDLAMALLILTKVCNYSHLFNPMDLFCLSA